MRVRSEKYKHLPSTTFRIRKPYEFLDIVQIRLEQNIFLACAFGGAERLISKGIYRSGYS